MLEMPPLVFVALIVGAIAVWAWEGAKPKIEDFGHKTKCVAVRVVGKHCAPKPIAPDETVGSAVR